MRVFDDPQRVLAATSLVEWFIEFVKIDTQSDAHSPSNPSTAKQLELQRVLEQKLRGLGCTDVRLDDKGYLYGTFPGNRPAAPVIGLIAHVDTATDFSGSNVQPIVHRAYAGGPLNLPNGLVIDPADNPELNQCIGDDIITASGDTLLGADDKAGVAAILAALELLAADAALPRPTLKIAFTPDEEIGRGAEFLDIAAFGASCAYTLDGDGIGEVNFETFSADKAVVRFKGRAVHPGTAKGKLVNALRHLGHFLDSLPRLESPEATELRQGFVHPIAVQGNAAEASAELILREFDDRLLAERGRRLRELAAVEAQIEPRLGVEVAITAQYRNMANALAGRPEVREHLLAAVRDCGLEPDIVPVRGGTDGSGLTSRGLPTPNIFTGGCNYHGPAEWVSTRGLALAACTIVNLVQRWAE